jgi:nicotinamidase-related amidase
MPGSAGAFHREPILFRQWQGSSGMTAVKRIIRDQCCGVLIDFQGFFLSQVKPRQRAALLANTANLLRLLNYFHMPLVATLERPLEYKGGVPKQIVSQLGDKARIFEKNFFDLCKEKDIKAHLARLKRRQVIVAGCETDVCVMQSCLGLIALGYDVFVIEDLIFSSAQNVASAIERMKAAGALFLSYKTLYYELIEAVEGGRHTEQMLKAYGPFPDDLPDIAAP